MEKKIVFNINKIINIILIIALCLLGWENFQQNEMIDKQTVQLSSKNTDDNKHTSIVYEQKLETLKKTNKELYDSLKIYKDEISYLAQFKHTKEYGIHEIIKPIKKNEESIDSVDVKNIVEEEVKEFIYENKEPNDTLNYQLRIGSTVEPNWYSVKFKVSETFTLVNKEVNGINETTIAPSTASGTISDVTILKQKEKLKDRISIGPSVTTGYCLINKKVDVMVGVSVTFDLW
jgi:FtsZ-interacting cell division protein ZipA